MEPTLAEIRLFGGNFAPRKWAFCQGQLLPIAQNQSLFSLLGTTYGGDGRTTFALPDLRGRTAVHPGDGPGLTTRALGEKFGTPTKTLTADQLAAHSHSAQNANFFPLGIDEKDNNSSPSGTHPSKTTNAGNKIYRGDHNVTMATQTVQLTAKAGGANQPVNNAQPCIGMNYIICINGLFPSRS